MKETLEKIAGLYERIEHAREAMRHIRAVEFGNRYHSFENVGAAMVAMVQRNSELTEIHTRVDFVRAKLQEDLFQLIKLRLDTRGEKETAALLYQLRRWHPWSYQYFYEVLEILRLKGYDDFLGNLELLMARTHYI